MARDKDELKKISERLVDIRKRLHFLQKDFASELGISNATLSEIEAGNNKPNFDLIYAITKKFNVNIYYLLHGQGDMFMPEDIYSAIEKKKFGSESEEWLKKFLYYFNESAMLRYAMMSYFSKFLLENGPAIESEIEKGKKDSTNDLE